ncbi:MAG TPA: sigma-54 dependent transcriptional regulator [Acidobacteriaceae bacterium]
MSDPVRASSSVLVVDDEPGIRAALEANFSQRGWQVETASGVEDATRALERRAFHLVVSDIRMRDGDGLEVMRSARRLAPSTAVILLTAFGTVPDAVRAMRSGAFDYMTKPISFEQLEERAERVMQQCCEAGQGERESGSTMVGKAPGLLRALQRARAAATTDADVLIEAESGTGKELLARLIHEASDRSRKPFIAVNCAAVPEHLLESELFGHARGAFTGAAAAKAGRFELAHGGTLLLDEIGEMPLHLQPKLLRALQEREIERLGETRTIKVDIRVIATTNVALSAAVEQGKFRSDLYYRLNVIPLTLPALRDRPSDIPLLARYFAEKYAAKAHRPTPELRDGFLERLACHSWPGNVRELGNFMRRVLSLHPGMELDEACFDEEFQTLQEAAPAAETAGKAGAVMPAGAPIRQLERMHLENTLSMTHGNRTQAAGMLGISVRTMRNRIREYGLPPRRYA